MVFTSGLSVPAILCIWMRLCTYNSQLTKFLDLVYEDGVSILEIRFTHFALIWMCYRDASISCNSPHSMPSIKPGDFSEDRVDWFTSSPSGSKIDYGHCGQCDRCPCHQCYLGYNTLHSPGVLKYFFGLFVLNSWNQVVRRSSLTHLFFVQLLVAFSQRLSTVPPFLRLRGVIVENDFLFYGGFANIHYDKLLNKCVAIKIPRWHKTRLTDNIQNNVFLKDSIREAIVMESIHAHPNILNILGVFIYNDAPCLVTPWMHNGTITEFL